MADSDEFAKDADLLLLSWAPGALLDPVDPILLIDADSEASPLPF